MCLWEPPQKLPVASLLKSVLWWERTDDLEYSLGFEELEGVEESRLRGVVHDLISHNAFPENSSHKHVGPDGGQHYILWKGSEAP